MKKLNEYQYLIERPMELSEALRELFVEIDEDQGDYHIMTGETPMHYPYVVFFEVNTENSIVDCHYVGLSAFRLEASDKVKLFEFNLRKTEHTSPYRVREFSYQLPARDVVDALVKLGQSHSKDELYELEVLTIEQVK